MTSIKIYSGVNTAIKWQSFCQLARLFSDVLSAFRSRRLIKCETTHPKAKCVRLHSCQIITKKKLGQLIVQVHDRVSSIIDISLLSFLYRFRSCLQFLPFQRRHICHSVNRKFCTG